MNGPYDDAVFDVAALLGYAFENRALAISAMTHKSFRNENSRVGGDNERLEFLGDAVLQLTVSAALMRAFPLIDEGELTRKRAAIVSEVGLAPIANRIGLGNALRLGKGEENTGGRQKPRLLASALEALLGAIYLDGGYEAARAAVDTMIAADLRNGSAPDVPGDFKSQAQEYAQRHFGEPPTYEQLSATGPDHDRTFEVALVVRGSRVATAIGKSKSAAEHEAARKSLILWEDAPSPPG